MCNDKPHYIVNVFISEAGDEAGAIGTVQNQPCKDPPKGKS